jgi:hypothetical protein
MYHMMFTSDVYDKLTFFLELNEIDIIEANESFVDWSRELDIISSAGPYGEVLTPLEEAKADIVRAKILLLHADNAYLPCA